jgi:hypothetical protein
MWPKGNIERQPSSFNNAGGFFMSEINRRSVLIGLAATIAATTASSNILITNRSKFLSVDRDRNGDPEWNFDDIDWDEIINDVIGDNNAQIAGFRSKPIDFQVGSPHWVMREAMQQLERSHRL